MIFRIDEDRIVGRSGHGRLAADADGFIKFHYSVRPLEHSGSWTGHHTGSMGALITARHLMRPAHLGKDTDIDVLDVGAGHTNGHNVFGLAGGGTRVTADAPCVIDYLGPLHTILARWWWLVDHLLLKATTWRAL